MKNTTSVYRNMSKKVDNHALMRFELNSNYQS